MRGVGLLSILMVMSSTLASAACDLEAIKAQAAERQIVTSTTTSSSEGAHLELACTDLKITSIDPLVIAGEIFFENQGGTALTIRGLSGGPSDIVELTKTTKFLGLFTSTRPVPTVRVNANSVRALSADLGYRLTLTGFPDSYSIPGITPLYVDLGPHNDPRWDARGQLLIVKYDKTLPE